MRHPTRVCCVLLFKNHSVLLVDNHAYSFCGPGTGATRALLQKNQNERAGLKRRPNKVWTFIGLTFTFMSICHAGSAHVLFLGFLFFIVLHLSILVFEVWNLKTIQYNTLNSHSHNIQDTLFVSFYLFLSAQNSSIIHVKKKKKKCSSS